MDIIKKIILSQALIWSMIFTPSIFASTPVAGTEIEILVNKYNAETGSLKNVLDNIKKLDSAKAKELKTFVEKTNIDQTIQMPKISHNGEIIELNYEGQKFTIKLFSDKSLKLFQNDRSVTLYPTMSPEIVKLEITKLLKEDGAVSLLDLFIPKAHAFIPEALVALFAVVVLVFALMFPKYMDDIAKEGVKERKQKALSEMARNSDLICERLSSASPDQVLDDRVLENYNLLSSQYLANCLVTTQEDQDGKLICGHIQKAKKCLQVSIEKARTTNNSSRGNVKKIEHDIVQDTYSTKTKQR